jgi:hypothetical protein
MWIVKIVLKVSLGLYSAVYAALPEKIKSKFAYLKITAIIAALLLVFIMTTEEITKYLNYSYAIISKEGTIIKSKNFKYKVEKEIYEDNPAYFIIGKYDLDNLTITTFEAATPEIAAAIKGIRIIFVGNGFGNPIIETKFKIEIKK